MKHLPFALVLCACGASFSWHLPIESTYDEAAQAASVLCPGPEVPMLASDSVAGAAVLPSEHGYTIVHNPHQLRRIEAKYGRSVVLWIVGHEHGHVCDMRQGLPGSELSADAFGGCVLGLAGESTEPTRLFLKAESNPATHPPAAERISALAQGWDACAELWK